MNMKFGNQVVKQAVWSTFWDDAVDKNDQETAINYKLDRTKNKSKNIICRMFNSKVVSDNFVSCSRKMVFVIETEIFPVSSGKELLQINV